MAMRWGALYRGTKAEHALEEAVACLGVPYRTQFPGYLYGFRYFLDFYLPTIGVVIEVDDPSHNRPEKMLKDADRTEALEARGFQVVRCTNEEAMADPHGTVKQLLKSIHMWPPIGTKTVAEALPRPEKAPQRNRREAKSAAIQARRKRGRRI